MRISLNKNAAVVAELCLVMLLGLAAGCAGMGLGHKAGSPTAVAARVQSDVVYGRPDGATLLMDVYYPSNAAAARLPVVMYVHGGGWQMGSKEMLAMMPGPAELLRRGYLVAAINYRLAPQFKFPAMLEDAKGAVRFLRAHATDFNLDPARVGVMGDSAGGQLVALLGLTGPGNGFEGETANGPSSQVQAVVDFYGPSDFKAGRTSESSIKLVKAAFGATNADDPVLVTASPVTYVSSHAPPFLILHGDHDGLVDPQQSVELAARLQAAGDAATLVVITNYAHGYTPLGMKSQPDFAGLSRIVADFFDHNLRPDQSR